MARDQRVVTPKPAAEVVEITVDGKTFAVPMIMRDFGGAVCANRYGDVEVRIGEGSEVKTYVVRVGAREWWKAEEEFKVKGDGAVVDAYKAEGEGGRLRFIKIALEAAHPGITVEEVAGLLDYKPERGPSLEQAVLKAMSFSRPERVSEKHPDPKALAVLVMALAATESRSESSTS